MFKQRNGVKETKRYDTATTPHQRAIGREDMRKRPIIRMNAEFKRVRPACQSRQILALTGRLEALSLAMKPAAVKPVVNHAFNPCVILAEVLGWGNESFFPEVLT